MGDGDAEKVDEESVQESFICSVIVPVYNGARFLKDCLLSILGQKSVSLRRVELILYDDASTDGSFEIAQSLQPVFVAKLGRITLRQGKDGPLGAGNARNKACEESISRVLVFLDADDVMRETRIARTLEALSDSNDGQRAHIVGGVFDRIPAGSTPRYENYHRRLSTNDLFAHAFRDAPLAFPTVACLKEVWEKVDGFVSGRGVPEDLHFLYDAMRANFRMVKLQGESLTGYRFHENMTSLTLHRRTLLDVRVKAFEALVLTLPNWKNGFSIWNSGRDGKDAFTLLSDSAKALVRAWGDIDPKKIGKLQRDRPIVHFSQLKAPIVCCVALDREGREFEANLASLSLKQGRDYVHLI